MSLHFCKGIEGVQCGRVLQSAEERTLGNCRYCLSGREPSTALYLETYRATNSFKRSEVFNALPKAKKPKAPKPKKLSTKAKASTKVKSLRGKVVRVSANVSVQPKGKIVWPKEIEAGYSYAPELLQKYEADWGN